MRFKTICILALLAIPAWTLATTDLGTVGEVYPVAEPDVREEMKREAMVNWERKKKEYQEKITAYQPVDLHQLPKARQNRTFLVDMSFTIDRDVKDRDGRVVYAKGSTFNPLEYIQLSIGLVVIDGRDAAQVKWFRESPYNENHRVKLLLSGGYVQELITDLNRAVFYLSRDVAERLRLTAVPCVAVQQGKQMQVTEFLIKEKR